MEISGMKHGFEVNYKKKKCFAELGQYTMVEYIHYSTWQYM